MTKTVAAKSVFGTFSADARVSGLADVVNESDATLQAGIESNLTAAEQDSLLSILSVVLNEVFQEQSGVKTKVRLLFKNAGNAFDSSETPEKRRKKFGAEPGTDV